jgi:hypothetical protein
MVVKTAGNHPGSKPNMCCAPATNGERAFGKVAPSSPASALAMKGTGPTISG